MTHSVLQWVVVFVAAVVFSACFAADPTTLVIPKITKPLIEPVANDPHQADYDKMWTEYEEAVQKATVAIKEAFDKQIAKATDGGELDLVEMWEGKQKRFAENGVLDWDTSSKASVEWKKANPKVAYPREFNDAVRSAASTFASAKEKLDEGYADLVKAYTKAKNVPRAKELRDEGAAVIAGTIKAVSPPQVSKRNNSPEVAGAGESHTTKPAGRIVFEWASNSVGWTGLGSKGNVFSIPVSTPVRGNLLLRFRLSATGGDSNGKVTLRSPDGNSKEVAKWTSLDGIPWFKESKPGRLYEIEVGAVELSSGEHTITFQYTSGRDSARIAGVEVVVTN